MVSYLFVTRFIQTNNKETMKGLHHWPFVQEIPQQLASYAKNIPLYDIIMKTDNIIMAPTVSLSHYMQLLP